MVGPPRQRFQAAGRRQAGAQVICTKCTGDKKGAHIMGLTLFWGMKRDGLKYREGSVLDPRDGSVYHALMNLSEDGNDWRCAAISAFPCSASRRPGIACPTTR